MIEELGDHITVVGTAHIAARSVEDVERTIREKRPDKVLVELDARRLEALRDPEAWKRTDILQVIKQKKQHLFLLQLYLAAMQARMGRDTGVAPGTEMIRAVQVAEEMGAEVVLIDRDVALTLKRGFGAMGFWQRLGLALNVVMEASPTPPEEAPRARQTPLPLVVMAGVMAAALILPRIGRLTGRLVDASLDALLGFPSFPWATLVLAGFTVALAGTLAMASMRRAGAIPFGALTAAATVCGVVLGWLPLFAQRGEAAFFARLVPTALGVPSGVAVAVALLGAGGLLGARTGTHIDHFQASRKRVLEHRHKDIEELLESDAITAMTEEFAAFAPQIKTALIDERDTYMASHILEHSKGSSVVAVVGAGHLPGIRRQVMAGHADGDREQLDRLPPKRLTIGKLVAYAFPAAILGVFVFLAASGRGADLLESIYVWIFFNGTLAALGALLARAHILSILTAFVAAPLTSLNPLLAAGWFAGAVEAKMHTPTVADFENVRLVETMKDFYRNPVVRVLLVTALANLGSAAGTYVAAWQIFQNLGVL